MGVSAIAVVRCHDRSKLEALRDRRLSDPIADQIAAAEARAGTAPPPVFAAYRVIGVGSDFALVHIGLARFDDLQRDPTLASIHAHRIVEGMPPGTHEGSSLVLIPDVIGLEFDDFEDAVRRAGAACIHASIEPLSVAERAEWQRKRNSLLRRVSRLFR